jgi:hypothetical protein
MEVVDVTDKDHLPTVGCVQSVAAGRHASAVKHAESMAALALVAWPVTAGLEGSTVSWARP